MKKSVFSLVLIILSVNLWSQPRPVKLSSTIIIDTDCGFDDMRAISLLLSRPEITIKAILTSEGTLPPEEGAEKVLRLLNEFHRSDIPVALGEVNREINPAWRAFNRSISWGRQASSNNVIPNSVEYLSKLLSGQKEKITMVCLGSLKSIHDAMRQDSSIRSKIDRIIWYNDFLKPLAGFNYECDKISADQFLSSKMRIDIISNLNLPNSLLDTSLVTVSRQSNTHLASALNYVLTQTTVAERLSENHFRFCDDLVALYLTNPELFDINTDFERPNIRYNMNYDIRGIREVISDMLNGSYVPDRNIVFNRFPIGREMFNYDIRPIIDTVIALYGIEEWKANVMTDEFHGHLGVFSIVGAKMGIKARELFGVGPDPLEATTYAGTSPPYSCLNDGIQVSTGATVGMGTIHVAKIKKAEPTAVFTYQNRSFRISLKKVFLEQAEKDINEGIIKFGLMDDGYWKLIRHNAIRYWVEWDRNKIFDIEEIRGF